MADPLEMLEVASEDPGAESLAAGVAVTLDLADLRIVAVEHPLGGIDEAAVVGRAEEAVEPTLRLLTEA